jgi:hypothetical protein
MRLILALALVACSSKAPPPDPATFRAMTPDEQCAATEPRGADCADEIMLRDIHALDMGSDAIDELDDRIRARRSHGSEAKKLHALQCLSSKGYPAAVLACWEVSDCDAFAACVANRTK